VQSRARTLLLNKFLDSYEQATERHCLVTPRKSRECADCQEIETHVVLGEIE
jgi:hypothetical protein